MVILTDRARQRYSKAENLSHRPKAVNRVDGIEWTHLASVPTLIHRDGQNATHVQRPRSFPVPAPPPHCHQVSPRTTTDAIHTPIGDRLTLNRVQIDRTYVLQSIINKSDIGAVGLHIVSRMSIRGFDQCFETSHITHFSSVSSVEHFPV